MPRTNVTPASSRRSTATVSSQSSVASSRIRSATGVQSGWTSRDPGPNSDAARLVERRGGRQHHLRGHAPVVGALAAHQAALDGDHVEAPLRELGGDVLASRPLPDHHDIDFGACRHAVSLPRCAHAHPHSTPLSRRRPGRRGRPGRGLYRRRSLPRTPAPQRRRLPGPARLGPPGLGLDPRPVPARPGAGPVRGLRPLAPHPARSTRRSPTTATGSAGTPRTRCSPGRPTSRRSRDAAAAFAGGDAVAVRADRQHHDGHRHDVRRADPAPGDEVLTTTHDFFSTEDALRLLELRTGAKVTRVDLYDDPAAATVDDMTKRLLRRRHPETRVVALTWVHSSTGVRVPVPEIAAELPRRRRPCCVDGVHGFAAVDVDLPDLGCDFLATGTHKWLFGPRGTGILWAARLGAAHRADPVVLRSRRPGPAHARRLPGLRAPVGGQGRLRVPAEHRPGPGGGPHRRAGHAAQGRAGRRSTGSPWSRRPTRRSRPASSASTSPGCRPPTPYRSCAPEAWSPARRRTATSYLRLGPSIATSPEQVDQAIAALWRR